MLDARIIQRYGTFARQTELGEFCIRLYNKSITIRKCASLAPCRRARAVRCSACVTCVSGGAVAKRGGLRQGRYITVRRWGWRGPAPVNKQEQIQTNSGQCAVRPGSWGRGSLRSVSRPNTIYNSRTLACLQTHAEHSTTPEPCPVFAERSYGMCTQYRPKYVHVQVGCHVVRPQNGTLRLFLCKRYCGWIDTIISPAAS